MTLILQKKMKKFVIALLKVNAWLIQLKKQTNYYQMFQIKVTAQALNQMILYTRKRCLKQSCQEKTVRLIKKKSKSVEVLLFLQKRKRPMFKQTMNQNLMKEAKQKISVKLRIAIKV